ncbi:carbohydrate esterase family 5 protein [Daldinia caldariorum]|uniref:carbohydrate esterase family 5 protein n=1 Tax=Daldinia caldariorum TaxID=326644 RepID=UPI0020087291|nr:carbohydrate esterase family 5 protein [Daldinia caldariorum]KAI1463490.1 carbohydrate esterase family 5 protein [Daldinia caldariorum]
MVYSTNAHKSLRKAILSGFAASLYFASISPVSAAAVKGYRDTAVSVNEWDPVLRGIEDAECADLAVIFARGTFDKGNLGPWVGGPFRDALVSRSADIKLAIQGVDVDSYPADLAGYVEEGGSGSCGASIGESVQTYVSHCPDAKVAIWGWSQGALCAHKAMGELGDAATNVIALGVFGDPVGVWQDSVDYPAIPEGVNFLSYCEKTTPDPLCANPTEDFPHTPKAFIDRLKDIWEEVDTTHMNDAQKGAVGELLIELPKQAVKELGQLATDIAGGHLRRWMLSPQHFWYGIDGKVETAADDLLRVYNSQK